MKTPVRRFARTPTAPRKITYAEWQKKCQMHADVIGVVAGDALWDENDSYSLKEEGHEAWAIDEAPGAFVERMFAEDLANMAHDNELARLARLSMEEGLPEDEEGLPEEEEVADEASDHV